MDSFNQFFGSTLFLCSAFSMLFFFRATVQKSLLLKEALNCPDSADSISSSLTISFALLIVSAVFAFVGCNIMILNFSLIRFFHAIAGCGGFLFVVMILSTSAHNHSA